MRARGVARRWGRVQRVLLLALLLCRREGGRAREAAAAHSAGVRAGGARPPPALAPAACCAGVGVGARAGVRVPSAETLDSDDSLVVAARGARAVSNTKAEGARAGAVPLRPRPPGPKPAQALRQEGSSRASAPDSHEPEGEQAGGAPRRPRWKDPLPIPAGVKEPTDNPYSMDALLGEDTMQYFPDGATEHLWRACEYGDAEAARAALEAGAQVNFTHARYHCRTPLHSAASLGEVDDEIVRMLIDAGADVNAEDEVGCRPLHMAAVVRLSAVARLRGGASDDAAEHEGAAIVGTPRARARRRPTRMRRCARRQRTPGPSPPSSLRNYARFRCPS